MTNMIKLSEILPERLKTPEILALVNALDPELNKITEAIGEVTIMPNIRGQPENIVDSLAWQLHVDFYEPLGLNLDKKRALVVNSLMWHRHKGTKYVLEDMIRLLFFERFSVEEWFEYGGRPYFFRLNIRDEPLPREVSKNLLDAINALKNERSWLDYVAFETEYAVSDFSAVGMLMFSSEYIVADNEEIVSDIFGYSAVAPTVSSSQFIIVDGEEISSDIFGYSAVAPTVSGSQFIIVDGEEIPSGIMDYAAVSGASSTREYHAEVTEIGGRIYDRQAVGAYEYRREAHHESSHGTDD